MTELPRRKVGIIACSGEEMAEGTVTRLAALRVLGYLRPDDTVTLCLPLFVAGGEGDRQFARLYPTIAVDGCDKCCAAHASEMYSGKPAASVVVRDVVAQRGIGCVEGRRKLNDNGKQAVNATADQIAALVDDLLGNIPTAASAAEPALRAADQAQEGETSCACGSGIPVQNILIDGEMVGFLALPLIMKQMRTAGKALDAETARELLNTVRIYTNVPDGADDAYAAALLRAYSAFCAEAEAA
jgi:hypothetical protein